MYQLVNVSLRVTIHSIPRSPLPTDAADPGEPDQDRVDFRLTRYTCEKPREVLDHINFPQNHQCLS